jgi:CDP-2,3-bis-(O-geranylgeranyl)-sn-glycerol synthase
MTFTYFITLLYIALPAFAANMAPVVAARLQVCTRLAFPVHARLLGLHKTWRGLFVGTLVGGAVALVQWFVWMPYLPGVGSALAFGLLAGSGALVGDMAKSVVKRALGIGSGRPFIPFDQIDYIVGMLVFTSLVYTWSVTDVAVLFVFVLIANPLTNALAYFAGVKNTFW